MCIFVLQYTQEQSTKKNICYKQKKTPYTQCFFTGGSLSAGVLDHLSDLGEGLGVAMRGEHLGTVGSATVLRVGSASGGGLGSAMTEGEGVKSWGERWRSAGLGAGDRD